MVAEPNFEFPNQGLTVFLKFGQKDPQKMSEIISQLGVEESWIRDEKNWHSRQLFEDFLNLFVQKYGDDAVYQAGIHMFANGQFKLGDSALGLLISPQLLFSKLPAMVKRMNKYNTYQYKVLPETVTSQSCLITQYYGSPVHQQFNGYMCDMARGSIEGSLKKLNYKLLSSHEEKCVKKGDDRCEFKITWMKRTTLWSYLAAAIPFATLIYTGERGWLPQWFLDSHLNTVALTASALFPAVTFWTHFRYRYRLTDIFDFQQQTLEQMQGILANERRLSQSLVEYQLHYQRAVRMATLGELSYGIVHDMASPITILQIGSGGLAESDYTPEELAKNVDMIHKATERLVLFQNLLRKTVRSGGIVEPTRVNVKQVVVDIGSLFISAARQKEIDFQTRIEVEEQLTAYCREDLLQRCLSNAVQNAINALSNAAVKRISIRVQRNGEQLMFEVSDSGPGISSSVLQKASSGMTQSGHSTGQIEGSGFGLFAMRKMAEEMQGKLEIQTDAHSGTTMRFIVPMDCRVSKVSA